MCFSILHMRFNYEYEKIHKASISRNIRHVEQTMLNALLQDLAFHTNIYDHNSPSTIYISLSRKKKKVIELGSNPTYKRQAYISIQYIVHKLIFK